jgi:hypothetical protein
MKVVGHETIGVDLPAGLPTRLPERFHETQAILVILEDGLTAVAAIHHMVEGARILEAKFTSHDGRLRKDENAVKCQKREPTPCRRNEP